ncbi:unnamed protein product [Triticum turgidum subsp. durum]|uniref:Cytochrome b6-f complex iron-sulfur subunit, chloroplastic n=1 Tax=Triticum turgidum subsp. durum TaxID=4567 RepID=A0A9R1PKD1_TRITD|nr:unnamed protein product [Triticum turgidum subsp. durum]
MASTALSTASNPTQLCRTRASSLCKPVKGLGFGRERVPRNITCMAGSISADRVPDMSKRELMNLLLLGAISLPTFGMLVPYGSFLVPAGSGSNAGGVAAKGDPTYLVVESDKTLATYGINAVCTHLGCVVPWNAAENKFLCPCHGSQYNNQGKVVRGPAPLSLALVHADVDDGKVVFVPWVETDFRTGDNPWWK